MHMVSIHCVKMVAMPYNMNCYLIVSDCLEPLVMYKSPHIYTSFHKLGDGIFHNSCTIPSMATL